MSDWAPIYISIVIGGPTRENRVIRNALDRVGRRVDEVEFTPAEGEAGVEIEFHVTGDLLAPDYEGMRTGRWSNKDNVQVVQIAVPTALEKGEEDEVVTELLRMIPEAVELAAQRLAHRRIKLDLSQARSIAGAVSPR